MFRWRLRFADEVDWKAVEWGEGRNAIGSIQVLKIGRNGQRSFGVAIAVFLLQICWGTVFAADDPPWVSKHPSEWTLEDAEVVLWHSPWVKFRILKFFGSSGRVREAKFYVRIQSARPVRLAMAEAYTMQPEGHVHRVGKVPSEHIEQIADQIELPGEIVFSVIAFPPSFHRRLNEQDPESLRKTVYLQAGETRIALKQFVPPERTTFGEAWFRFPRPVLDSQTDKIRFQATLKVPRNFKINCSFSLAELIFQGEPAY